MGVVYTQPSMQERRSIQDQWRAYCSVTSLRSSTRSNALSGPVMPFLRNTQDPLGGRHQCTRRRRSTQRKLVRHPDLYNRVIEHLKNGWTPEQIGNRMINEGTEQRTCHPLPPLGITLCVTLPGKR